MVTSTRQPAQRDAVPDVPAGIADDAQTYELRKRTHPWRWVVAAVAAYLIAGVVASLAANPAMDWPTVGRYLFNQQILDGLVVTLVLTLVVSVLGNVFGALVAACWLSSNPVLRVFAWGYVWLFRSIPMLVQLLFWFNIGYLYPRSSSACPSCRRSDPCPRISW